MLRVHYYSGDPSDNCKAENKIPVANLINLILRLLYSDNVIVISQTHTQLITIRLILKNKTSTLTYKFVTKVLFILNGGFFVFPSASSPDKQQ